MHRTTARPAIRIRRLLALVLFAAVGVALAVIALAMLKTTGLPAVSLSGAPTSAGSEVPAIANLDPALRDAVRAATADAAADGVDIVVNSGWRTPEEQEALLQEAIATHGSEQEAARWVASPDTSAHVSGDAVDVGPWDGWLWLEDHGARYGLCQVYDNEPWHFELRPEAVASGCPATYPDPTHDPRLQG